MTNTTDELMVWNITGSDPYSEEGLIRFSNSILSSGYFSLNASDTKMALPAIAWKFALTYAWP